MSLDACVYCDCYEKGRLISPPPEGMSLYVSKCGALEYEDCNRMPIEQALGFDKWLLSSCEHPDRIFIHHFLGNIATIEHVRSELMRKPDLFPIILTRVVYNGVHCGDFLDLETIQNIQQEIDQLPLLECSSSHAKKFLSHFHSQMKELTAAALSLGKPIAF
jgi:hypothetical protein